MGRPASRPRSTCRPRWASTPTIRAPRARSERSAWRSTARGHGARCSTASRSTGVSTSMTINATAPILLLLYELVAERAGRRRRGAAGHGPERPPEGVRGAGHLHLSAQAVDAFDHRPVRILPTSASRSGTPSRSAATTCARRARRPPRRSPSRSPTGSPTCRRRSTRGWASTTSRRGCRSSSHVTSSSSRRSRSSARHGGCGRGSCVSASGPRTRVRWRSGSTRKPAGRR